MKVSKREQNKRFYDRLRKRSTKWAIALYPKATAEKQHGCDVGYFNGFLDGMEYFKRKTREAK